MMKLWLGVVLSLALPALLKAQGTIDKEKLQELKAFCVESGADKFAVIHNEKWVTNWENPDCDSTYMNTASMVKSWTGLMIGILINEGLIGSVDDNVCEYLPEWAAGCEQKVTIRHLLTMTSGLLKKPAVQSVLAQSDMNAFVLQTKLDVAPGTKFSYSNESVQLLGLVIERVCGKSANACFEEKLFEPLGMDSTRLWQDRSGNDVTYGGCQTTIQDAAQIGLMVSNDGKYNGERIVSSQWLADSFTGTEQAPRYGYLWWIDPNHNSVAAMGDFGQMTIYFPDLDLIFVRQQSCQNSDRKKNLNWMGPDFLELLRSVVKAEDGKMEK